MPLGTATPRPGPVEVWRRPLPHLKGQLMTQVVVRSMTFLARRYVVEIEGLEHLEAMEDPFVFAANHSQRLEAVMLPGLLFFHRGGIRIHFMADWAMMLVPGVGLMYRCGEVIPVGGKKPKIAFLDRLKKHYVPKGSAWDRAAEHLRQGKSVGIFPEGTVNRDPEGLLRGRPAAARLAVEQQVPVLPAGIRFPENQGEPIVDGAKMAIRFAPPLTPPPATVVEGADPAANSRSEKRRAGVSSEPGASGDVEVGPERADPRPVREFHARIMTELARLSGKRWHPGAPRRKTHGSQT
ncbi:MAG: lysophospholipid acyltransferase family protein [Acidobacteriota bacterium]